MSIDKIRKKYGTKVCLIGNVDSSHTLVYGTEDRIVYETLETIRDGALEGALILASDSDIRDEMPFENVDLMFKTALQYGIYPIDVAAIEERMKRCTVE
jgi:uroporphyrinogen decarboxylase